MGGVLSSGPLIHSGKLNVPPKLRSTSVRERTGEYYLPTPQLDFPTIGYISPPSPSPSIRGQARSLGGNCVPSGPVLISQFHSPRNAAKCMIYLLQKHCNALSIIVIHAYKLYAIPTTTNNIT